MWAPAFRGSAKEFFARLSEILDERMKACGMRADAGSAESIIGGLFGSSVMRTLAAAN